jgi:hypothetical protein
LQARPRSQRPPASSGRRLFRRELPWIKANKLVDKSRD